MNPAAKKKSGFRKMVRCRNRKSIFFVGIWDNFSSFDEIAKPFKKTAADRGVSDLLLSHWDYSELQLE